MNCATLIIMFTAVIPTVMLKCDGTRLMSTSHQCVKGWLLDGERERVRDVFERITVYKSSLSRAGPWQLVRNLATSFSLCHRLTSWNRFTNVVSILSYIEQIQCLAKVFVPLGWHHVALYLLTGGSLINWLWSVNLFRYTSFDWFRDFRAEGVNTYAHLRFRFFFFLMLIIVSHNIKTSTT